MNIAEPTRPRRRARWRRFLLAAAAVALAVPVVVADADPASADEPALLDVTKTASVETVAPGETFTYTITAACTTFGVGCTNATISDLVPSEFIVEGTPVVTGSPGTATAAGQQVTVVFTSVLDDPVPGAIGLPTNATAEITVTVRADPALPFSASGIPVTNTADFTATNPDTPPDAASVDVTPIVPLELAAGATKSIIPEGALASPGTTAVFDIGGSNASNGPVETLVLQDPPDPEAAPNPFDFLALTTPVTVTLPDGAEQVVLEVFVDGAWVAGPPSAGPTVDPPAGVDLDAVTGVRLTFSSTDDELIPPGASAASQVTVVQRENVTELEGDVTVSNTVQATVGAGGETSAPATATATYLIGSGTLAVGATKAFSPDAVTAGDPTDVTLTGTNASSQTVDELVITEPSPGTPNMFESGVTFDGWGTGASGDGITWPANATQADVTFVYADGSTAGPLTTTEVDTLPDPPPSAQQIVGFEVAFSGPIVPGATATVPFGATTSPDQDVDELVRDNVVEVTTATDDGATGSATAGDSLTSYVERLAVTTEKQISPGQILAVPGEPVVVQLPSQLAPFPESTTDATQIVVQDPQVVPPVPSPDPWWDAFDAAAITQTAVPAGATLSVNYWDGSAWVPLPGAQGIAGPTIVNIPIPAGLQDDIQGLQFVYENPDGFPPGTAVQPNFTSELRSDSREDGTPLENVEQTIEDCASATATAGEIAADATAACATVDVIPTTPGVGDLIEKEFLESQPGAGQTVIARSNERIDAVLHWSTGGYSNLDQVVLSDVADPEGTAIADSMYDAFDLVAVPAISADADPYLTYDQVSAVELWNGTAWVPATNDPCPAACDGTFPGLTLTVAERSTTTSVRLTYVESPTRAERIEGDPTAPQVGSGVARSIGNDRDLLLTFAVRDTRRSDSAPALGSTVGTIYNLGTPGDVLDTASATGFDDGGQVVRDEDSDVVTILDVPLNVDITKSWTGGPLGIPPEGTAPEAYPSGRVSITATNATAARVDTLAVTDPMVPGSDEDPFAVFDLLDIVTISVPPGTITTTVTLARAGGPPTEHTRAEALALTTAQLADAVGITVAHDGRIAAGANAGLTLDLRLRATDRGTGEPITQAASPVANRAEATVADLGGNIAGATPTADDDATIALAAQDISVATTKTFSPDTLVEPSTGPVTMTLTGRPGGSSRANRMVITDDDPQFWNQYDFLGFGPSFLLTAPITRVQVDAFVGGTFDAGPDGVEVTGGDWVVGTPVTAANVGLPAGVTAADVQGLRFTFTRADGSIWENPANPLQTIPLQVERRDTLRTGGPVLTDLAGNPPAPGETAAGVASNSVDALVEGAVLVDGEPISATDDADASILYQHATNSVTVRKTAAGSPSGGSQAPGAPLPYTLEVTNSGAVPLVDPVIVDDLPADAGGPQLTFDPTQHPGGAGAFSYELTGDPPDPPSGPAMPTDPTAVTTGITGDVEEIAFTFPAGTVLEVGQTYVITIQLMFRPGLEGGTLVENSFGVTGDRPWDECLGGELLPDGQCSTDASVTVVASGALRGTKLVRAVDTELGVVSQNPAVLCVPGSQGFFGGPCTPITKPGGDEIWRLGYLNTGNLPMTELIAIDRLPTPGDTGVINPLPRQSQWRPLFEGSVTLTAQPGLPAGATLTVEWTDSDDLCLAGDACPPGSWNTLVSGLAVGETADPALLTDAQKQTVTALRLVVTFPTGDPFQPLDQLAIDLTTTTPAFSPTAGPDTIAWNSVAVQATALDGTDEETVPPTEGAKVGVVLATGPLSVEKVVEGDGADAYAPDEFPLTLHCNSAVGTWVEQVDIPLGDKAAITAVPGETTTVVDLPYGAVCTVAEDDTATLPTEFDATTVVVGRDDAPVPVVIATNTYGLASLELAKAVASTAVDEEGNPVAYGPFELTVECTFLGEAVFADGYGPDTPMVVELDDGETVEVTGLPARATCTVTETDAKGGTPSFAVSQGGGDPVVSEGDSVELDLVADPEVGTDPQNDVTATNTFGTGDLALAKVVTGDGADLYGAGPYTLHVACTLDDASGSRVVYDADVVLGGDQPLTATITDLAAGASCEVTETDDGGATSSAVDGSPATVGSDAVVTVTATNTFDLGALEVTKVVDGDGAELYGAGPFVVTLACTLDGADIEIPGGATRPLGPDAPAVYDQLPIGAECTVSESATGGATSTVVAGGEDGVVTIDAAGTATATVTNTFDVGEVRVVKRLEGPGAGGFQDATFTFQIACTLDVDGTPRPVEIPGGDTREASAATDWVAVFSDLPIGATCQVRETTTNDADVVELVVGEESTTTEPAEGVVPESPSFQLPEGDDVCLPIEAINTWNAVVPASAGGLALRPLTLTAASQPTPADQLAIDAGCTTVAGGGGGGGRGGGSPSAGGRLPFTGADILLAALTGAVLVTAGGALARSARRRRAAE